MLNWRDLSSPWVELMLSLAAPSSIHFHKHSPNWMAVRELHSCGTWKSYYIFKFKHSHKQLASICSCASTCTLSSSFSSLTFSPWCIYQKSGFLSFCYVGSNNPRSFSFNSSDDSPFLLWSSCSFFVPLLKSVCFLWPQVNRIIYCYQ